MAILLETSRLILREWIESDISELVPLIGAREVADTTLRIPYPYDEEHARKFIASVPKGNELRLAIRLRGDGRLVGGIGLHPNMEHQRAELGYWIGVPFWGKGYATEAAREVVRYGFETFKLNRIFAGHFEGNPGSRAILLKLGMRYEGCARQSVLKWGKPMDVHIYAILREEHGRG
jgi:ribosomal-protein-alanine N-acetyltransferase